MGNRGSTPLTSCGIPLAESNLPTNYCAHALPGTSNLDKWRSVIATGPNSLLAIRRSPRGQIVHVNVETSTEDKLPSTTVTVVAESPEGTEDLNHGMALHDGYLYASSSTTVYRWRYTPGTETSPPKVGDIETVIVNVSKGAGTTLGAPGGHTTRTLALDESGRLYVSVGSKENVDDDSFRSRIRRFELPDQNSTSAISRAITLPIEFETGEVFADGLRNEVGLAFDSFGILWGVENGPDNLKRKDLGGDIHNNNPAEELNRFTEETAGKHWGYPYCWSEYSLKESVANGRGSVWAWPSFMDEYSDETCRSDYETSIVAMQAHSAPLGITFYHYTPPENLPSICQTETTNGYGGQFPQSMDGAAIIAFHGSWNRDVPTGYKVVYIPMNTTTGMPLGDGAPIDLLSHNPPRAKWRDGYRPVDVDFDECGRLFVTSDGSRGAGSKIVRISFEGGGVADGEEGVCCGSASVGFVDSAGAGRGLHPMVQGWMALMMIWQLFSRKQ